MLVSGLSANRVLPVFPLWENVAAVQTKATAFFSQAKLRIADRGNGANIPCLLNFLPENAARIQRKTIVLQFLIKNIAEKAPLRDILILL